MLVNSRMVAPLWLGLSKVFQQQCVSVDLVGRDGDVVVCLDPRHQQLDESLDLRVQVSIEYMQDSDRPSQYHLWVGWFG